jgi:hypothetical protein
LKEPSYKSQAERYTAISRKVKAIAERWLGGSSIVVPDIGFCGALHAVAGSGYTQYEQYLFGERLAKELLGVT